MFPDRIKYINKVDSISKDWDNVKLAIRPECRNDKVITKAQTAISVGLNDAAINYFWNLSMYDLHRKIIVYGIDYFSSSINWDGKPLKTIEDLRDVKDYQIITGAYNLGIIIDEAHFFLQQNREIRNSFSTAHYPMGDIDPIETFNFIKNCIKYVLTFDLPAPGLQIRDLIENLSIEKLHNAEELKLIIESQSPKLYGPILHSLFSNYIKLDCPNELKHNISLIVPHLWNLVDESIKSTIGQKFVSLKDIKGKDVANEALEFLKIVDGVSYLSESYKEIIFKKQAQFLIDAHMGMNNFYSEPAHAKDLMHLGTDIPFTALYTYVKAITISYIGNSYGIANAAQEYNEKMIKSLSNMGVKTLFKILKTDLDIIGGLMNFNPAKRFLGIINILKDKTLTGQQKNEYEIYKKLDANKIKAHFHELYWKQIKRK